MTSELVRRVGFAAIAIPLALVLTWYGGWPFALLLTLATALGTAELFGLAERVGIRPARRIGIGTSAALPVVAWLALSVSTIGREVERGGLYVAALWLIGLLCWALWARSPTGKPLEAVSVTLLGVLYTGALPAFAILIRHAGLPVRSWAGASLVFFPLIVTWICDTAAMFGGRTFKGPKLAPTVSPGKTKSGAVLGVMGAVAVAPLFSEWIFPSVGIELGFGPAVAIAVVLSVVGQVGDLAESLIKRQSGVKDSSRLIPGHGGVLDRLDSLYFVVPATAAMYRYFEVIR